MFPTSVNISINNDFVVLGWSPFRSMIQHLLKLELGDHGDQVHGDEQEETKLNKGQSKGPS